MLEKKIQLIERVQSPTASRIALRHPYRVTALITQMLYLGVLDKIFVGAAPRVLALPTFSTMTREAQAILPVLQLRHSGSTSVYEPHVLGTPVPHRVGNVYA